jgi:putative FmdB family regulatory protein
MPVYTYRCSNCGFVFDQQQKFSDTPLIKCPECGKKTLNKVYQPVGIVFKGSGFYSTDHRSPSGQGRSSGSKSGEEKSPTNEKSSSSDNSAGNEKSSESSLKSDNAKKE